MPTVRVNGIDLYYEEHGSGEPLLLIMGWGGNAATWKPQIPGLAERFRVIAFDNRGAGRSDVPGGPYSIEEMAADTIGLLDALDVDQAHVFGVSMGGMIAQELALEHSERVETLVLGCTTSGGNGAAGRGELRRAIDSFLEMSADELGDMDWFAEFLKRLWTEETIARFHPHLQDFVFSLIRFPPKPRGLRAQVDAISAHDASARVQRIRQPTLVTTGADDALIDAGNSEILAEQIPNAELRIFPRLKHAFHLERPDLVNALIIDFIERVHRDRDATLSYAATDA